LGAAASHWQQIRSRRAYLVNGDPGAITSRIGSDANVFERETIRDRVPILIGIRPAFNGAHQH